MNTIDHQVAFNQALARIIGKSMRSPGTKALISEILKESVSTWAQGSRLRKMLAVPALWFTSRRGRPGKGVPEGSSAADVGVLLTELARKVNTGRASGKHCHDGTSEGAIDALLRNIDFGEIMEMMEGSSDDTVNAIASFNAALWKYPAKVGCILGTFLGMANNGIRAGREVLRPIENNVGPDLLADMSLSLLKGLSAREAAGLINAVGELIRRIHTGSSLLAKAGKPLFQVYLTSLLREALPEIDPVLMRKARVALAEDREAVAYAVSDALSENTALVLEMVSAFGSIKTPLVKAQLRKVRLFEEIGQEELAEAASKGLSDLDTYEIAEVANGFLRVINQIHKNRPEVFSNIAQSIADSVDPEEVRTAARWIVPEIVEAARPIFSAAMPQIINGLCTLLCDEDAGRKDGHREAMENLRAVLLAAGGER